MSKKILRCVWLVDSSPADVYGSDVVSVPNKPANHTFKAFTMPVFLRYTPTAKTGSTGVSRIYQFNWNTSEYCLVFNEAAKLMETPTVVGATLALSNSCPTADTREVFKGYSAFSVFSFRNQQFADTMVDVSGETAFFSATFLEQTLSRLGSDGLQFTSEIAVPCADSVEFFSTPYLPVTIDSYVVDAEVNTKPFFCIVNWWFGNIHNHAKIEHAVSDYEVCLPSDSAKFLLLVGTKFNGDYFSSVQCGYRYSVNAFPTENSLVVNYGSIISKSRLDFLLSLVGFSDFAYGSNRQLSGQTVLASNAIVDELLKPEFVGCSMPERYISDFVAGIVKCLHCLGERLSLFRCWQELGEERLLHNFIEMISQYLKFLQFLPQLKPVGILGGYR